MMKLPWFIRLLPVLELIVFLIVGYFIGYRWAILLLVFTSVLGILFVRRQGLGVMQQMKENPFAAAPAFIMLLQNSRLFLTGILLLIPGFITDVMGILCLFSGVRRFLFRRLLSVNMKSMQSAFIKSARQSANEARASAPKTIDGESWRDNSPE